MSRTKIDYKVELGIEVEDEISGYKGIVTSITNFLYGCKRIGVSRRNWTESSGTEENFFSEKMFDEPQLKVIGKGVKKEPEEKIVKEKATKKSTGGNRSLIPSRHN